MCLATAHGVPVSERITGVVPMRCMVLYIGYHFAVGFSALWGRLCLVGCNDARSLCIVSMYRLVAVTQVLPGGGWITLCNSIELLCDRWFHRLKLFCLAVSVLCCACAAFYAMFRELRVELPAFLVMAPRKAGRLKLANPRNWGWRRQLKRCLRCR